MSGNHKLPEKAQEGSSVKLQSSQVSPHSAYSTSGGLTLAKVCLLLTNCTGTLTRTQTSSFRAEPGPKL